MFDSKLEARRYGELVLLEAAGEISGLLRQVPWPLKVNDKLVCKWVVDFLYVAKDGTPVLEDVKGMITRDASIKIKLARALYPNIRIEIWKGK